MMVYSLNTACRALLLVLIIQVAWSQEDENFVIIEKPEIVEYEKLDGDLPRQGSPAISLWSSQVGFAYLKKQFTFVEAGEEAIDSSFYGAFYALAYNWRIFSIAADVGIYTGSKDGSISGEESNTGLQKSLKNQYLGEVGLNLYLNSFSNWYFRPYVGGGAYINEYKYIENDSSTTTKSFNINSSFYRAGLAFNIGAIDEEAAMDSWKETGIFRTQLLLEAKKYTSLEPSVDSQFEVYSALVFEY
ncbi:MAG: hypothetical protein CL674_01555 [Bdellovibrionaceae bacterium]|nr:hypothetical protein [Pseudobdellovibrionaceae bacterium]|tara:strand:- start:17912 stop:18646 length:735 start_codon:yes stop_codon:yes gene_type:complete